MGEAQTTGPKGEPLSAIKAVRVEPTSPADKSGIQDGDLILAIDNLDINKNPSAQEFFQHVRGRNAGETAKLSIKRDDQFINLEVKLGDVPPNQSLDPEQVEANRKRQFEEWLTERLEEERRKPSP